MRVDGRVAYRLKDSVSERVRVDDRVAQHIHYTLENDMFGKYYLNARLIFLIIEELK